MHKQVKEALGRLNRLREEWLEQLSHLTEFSIVGVALETKNHIIYNWYV